MTRKRFFQSLLGLPLAIKVAAKAAPAEEIVTQGENTIRYVVHNPFTDDYIECELEQEAMQMAARFKVALDHENSAAQSRRFFEPMIDRKS